MSRREEGRFDDLLSRRTAERLLTSTGLRYPAFRLVKAGKKLSVADYTKPVSWRPAPFTGTVAVEQAVSEFARGGTIVLQALHVHHHPLAAFTRELEEELGEPTQANAYYTPRAAQGLPIHHDTHDVFVLQVAGKKRWLIYAPALELPLRDQKYVPDSSDPGSTVLDVTLEPGDTLYLPRGWLHEALTSESDSLHLTIGVNVYTWLDALRAALDDCEQDVAFRRGVGRDAEGAEGLVAALAARLSAADVSRRRRIKLVRSRRPILEDAFDQLRALDELTPETPILRRRPLLFDLSPERESVRLAFTGKELAFPPHVLDELEALAAAEEPLTAAELPGSLDDAGRLVLVRRLVREGFLRIAATRDESE